MMTLGSIKTTFRATAALGLALGTVVALGTVASPAFADDAKVTASPGGACAAGKECTVTVNVHVSTEGVHVNTEYNHKVTVNDPGGVTLLGKTKPTLFSRDDGDFRAQEKDGFVTVRFKAGAKGKVTIAGTYKFATCKEGGGGCTPGSGPFSVDVQVK